MIRNLRWLSCPYMVKTIQTFLLLQNHWTNLVDILHEAYGVPPYIKLLMRHSNQQNFFLNSVINFETLQALCWCRYPETMIVNNILTDFNCTHQPPTKNESCTQSHYANIGHTLNWHSTCLRGANRTILVLLLAFL